MIAKRSLLVLVGLGMVGTLITKLPLRWFVPDRGLSAGAVTGSVWSGRIDGASIGPLRLGDLRAGLRWPGRLALAVDDPAQPDALRALASRAGSDGVMLDAISGTLRLDTDLGPLRLESARLRAARIDWPGECREASGRMTLVAKVTALSALPPVSLGGTIRCEGGALKAQLKSQSGLELADFSAFPNGRWTAALTVRPPGPELASALLASGFAETPLGYARTLHGGGE